MFCVGSGSQLAYAILDTVSSEGEPVRKKEVLVEAVAAPLMMTELPSEAETDDSTFSENVTATSRIPMPPRDIIANTAEGLAALSLEDAIRTAVKAVRHATYRDGFSGGYINVLVVNATGIHHVKRVDSKTIPL